VRRAATAFLACLFLAGAALPAGAATTTVSVVDFAFSPTSIKVAQGDTVQWHNTGARTHTATQDAPLSSFTTGTIAPGATSPGKVLNAAGTYPYHCTIHPSMVASIKVPVKVRPTSGTAATVFTITVAAQAAPTGFVYDVQQRVGDGPWAAYLTGVATASVTFQATSAGTYAFRSTLRKVSTGAKSKPSPAKAITVS
jgi:plastocyanin